MKQGLQDNAPENCYLVLRQLIITSQLAPGARLTEREIMQRLGCGRTPIREALLRLDQDGLIQTMPRSGYRVKPMTAKSIEDFFAVWRVLAPLLVTLSTPRLTEKDREVIREIGTRKASLHIDDAVGLSRIAGSFFDLLVRTADNEPLTHCIKRLNAEMELIFIMFFRTSEGRDWFGTGNDIVAYANVQDPNLASKLILQRIEAAENSILKYFNSISAVPPLKSHPARPKANPIMF